MKKIDTTIIDSIRIISSDTSNYDLRNTVLEIKKPIQEIVFDNIYILLLSTLILVLCFIIVNKTKSKTKGVVLNKNDFKSDSKSDFGNVFSGLANQKEAKKLKDNLLRKCHPDRFPNDKDLNFEANRLSSLVTKNAYNLNRLRELEIEIEEILLNEDKN